MGAFFYNILRSLVDPNTGEVKSVVGPNGYRRNLRLFEKIAFVGDSITAQGSGVRGANLVPNGYVPFPLTPTLTNLTQNYVRYVAIDPRAPSGAGTLAMNYPLMTWAAFGETAGTPVDISSGGFFYLPSSVANHGLVVGLNTAFQPVGLNLSDPITVGGSYFISNNSAERGYGSWIMHRTGNPFSAAYNFGITGDTTAGLLKRIGQIADADVDAAIVLIGTNDIDGTSAATAAATCATAKVNLLAIWQALRTAGIYVIAGTVLPSGDGTTVSINKRAATEELNAFIMTVARNTAGMECCDFASVIGDPTSTTGAPLADRLNASDLLHPSSKGAYVMASQAIPAIQRLFPSSKSRAGLNISYDAVVAQQGNLLTNGFFTGTGGGGASANIVGSIPSSWTMQGGANITCTTKAPADASPSVRTDGIPGNWWEMVVTGFSGQSIGAFQSSFINASNFAAGDVLELVADVQVFGTGIRSLDIYLQHATPSVTYYATSGDVSTTSNGLFDLNAEQPTMQIRSLPYTLPPGVTNLNVSFAFFVETGGTATLRLARFKLRKVKQ